MFGYQTLGLLKYSAIEVYGTGNDRDPKCSADKIFSFQNVRQSKSSAIEMFVTRNVRYSKCSVPEVFGNLNVRQSKCMASDCRLKRGDCSELGLYGNFWAQSVLFQVFPTASYLIQ